MVEDAFNERWKELVTDGVPITFDKSRAAGWYTPSITIGSKPKTVPTSATLHLMCVTFRPLLTYKLRAHVYSGREDEVMNKNSERRRV